MRGVASFSGWTIAIARHLPGPERSAGAVRQKSKWAVDLLNLKHMKMAILSHYNSFGKLDYRNNCKAFLGALRRKENFLKFSFCPIPELYHLSSRNYI